MKKIILLELCFLFLATTFQSDRMIGWVQQTIPRQDMPVRDLQFLDSLTGFLVVSKINPDTSFIYKTIDGGNNWSTIQLDNIYLTSLKFVTDNIGYGAGGQDTTSFPGVVKKTTNGGQNWFTVSFVSDNLYLMDIDFVNKDTGWVCSTDLISGGLWRTTNGGNSWQKQLNETYKPSKIFFVNNNTGWFIGNLGANLYKTTNCGENWFAQASFNDILTDVFFATQDTGWIVKGIGPGQISIMRSTNGGNNWQAVNSPIIPTEGRLFFLDNRIGWGGGGLNKIFATKDGYNWGIQSSPIRSYRVSFADSSKGWAGYSGLVHTTDGGGPITDINTISTEVPGKYELFQNYPNPFNSMTNIKWSMLNSSFVKIIIYDIRGKEIATLINERKGAGKYSVTFTGNNLSSGIYFYQLIINSQPVVTKKMTLIK